MNGSRWACWVALPLALLLWAGIALVVKTPLLPTPAAVLETFWLALQSGELPEHLLVTLRRVLIAFALAMALGTLLGVWMGRSRLANALLDPLLVLFLNLPALVTIILLYVWFGLVEAAAVLAV
ncbi:MAG: ABC transporter permease, partial [Gammaproteobacteria bacterium]